MSRRHGIFLLLSFPLSFFGLETFHPFDTIAFLPFFRIERGLQTSAFLFFAGFAFGTRLIDVFSRLSSPRDISLG
jgi:hypothetical protein